MNLDDDDDQGYKVLVIGPPKAGKTTFITRYVHGDYFADEAYKKTVGVDFALKHLHLSGDNGKVITLQLWDIAGDERTEKMTRIYYNAAKACVLMFDMTNGESLDVCSRWKKDLDSKCTLKDGTPIPCILLANKSDLSNQRKVAADDIKTFAQQNGFVCAMETSVKNDVNVTEAMDFLVGSMLRIGDGDFSQDRPTEGIKLPANKSMTPSKSGCC